jgi:hypothetical protein
LIEYEDASPEVRAVFEDIMAARQVNNVWKALAPDGGVDCFPVGANKFAPTGMRLRGDTVISY